jgi:hypothetical protein
MSSRTSWGILPQTAGFVFLLICSPHTKVNEVRGPGGLGVPPRRRRLKRRQAFTDASKRRRRRFEQSEPRALGVFPQEKNAQTKASAQGEESWSEASSRVSGVPSDKEGSNEGKWSRKRANEGEEGWSEANLGVWGAFPQEGTLKRTQVVTNEPSSNNSMD